MASKALIGGGIAAAAALVLVVTNPSLTDFTARMNAQNGYFAPLTCQGVETGNYVLFSRYEYRCVTFTKKYVGVLGNYYETGGKADVAQTQG